MNELSSNNAPTFESVWASMQETDRQFKETDRKLKQLAKLHAKNERDLKKSRAETDRQLKETDRILSQQYAETKQFFKDSQEAFEKRWAKYEEKLKKTNQEIGAWANNFGSFAEEYFFNSFDYGEQFFFGERFDEISRKVKPKERGLEDEYDIVLYNGTSVAIIEVKYKAHENDIPCVLKKAETFRILCPSYKNYKIYLALASMAFYPELEQECMKHGIAIIKQVGDMVVIEDGHLKVF